MLGCPAAGPGERRAWLGPRESSSESSAWPGSGGCNPAELPGHLCAPQRTGSSLLVASAQRSLSPGDMAEHDGGSGGSAQSAGQFLLVLAPTLGQVSAGGGCKAPPEPLGTCGAVTAWTCCCPCTSLLASALPPTPVGRKGRGSVHSPVLPLGCSPGAAWMWLMAGARQDLHCPGTLSQGHPALSSVHGSGAAWVL